MPDTAAITAALRDVLDPELELGMLREIEYEGEITVVHMILTTITCPLFGLFVDQVKTALSEVSGVRDVDVRFDARPHWSPELMSDSARHELEFMGLLPTTTWLN